MEIHEPFTNRESRIVEFLQSNRGHVVSTREIIAFLDPGTVFISNHDKSSIRKHISTARKKGAVIETHQQRGYSIGTCIEHIYVCQYCGEYES